MPKNVVSRSEAILNGSASGRQVADAALTVMIEPSDFPAGYVLYRTDILLHSLVSSNCSKSNRKQLASF